MSQCTNCTHLSRGGVGVVRWGRIILQSGSKNKIKTERKQENVCNHFMFTCPFKGSSPKWIHKVSDHVLKRLKTSLCKSAGGWCPLPPEVLRKKKKRVRLLRVQKPQQRLQPQPRLEAHTNTNTGRARNHNSAVTKVQEPAWRSPCGADNSHSASCWCPRERESWSLERLLSSRPGCVPQPRESLLLLQVKTPLAGPQFFLPPARVPPSAACAPHAVRLRPCSQSHSRDTPHQPRGKSEPTFPSVHFLPPFLG